MRFPSRWVITVLLVGELATSSVANAALIGRLPATPGGTDYQAYYDDDLNITWAADANINGPMLWADALTWAAGLTIGGVTGWRLPTAWNSDGSGPFPCVNYNCTGSEMGHLFYNELGGTAGWSVLTSGDPDLAKFTNVQSDRYWSATEYPFSDLAYDFDFSSGNQDIDAKVYNWIYAWAVHSGDVSAVPVPAAVWLFGSGLLGLFGVARRKVRV